jgi:solute carrier family 50 protein (sugar transporter)
MYVSPIVEEGLRYAGPFFFLGMQASSIKTGFSIVTSNSTLQLSLLPFISLLLNCIIWTQYGILKEDNTIIVPNAIGIFTGIFCTTVYLSKSHSPKSQAPLILGAAVIGLCCSVAYFYGDIQSLGLMGCALAVCVMGSPLATLKNVIVTKSTASIPFTTSFFMWLNSLSWMSYGLLISNDIMVYGPNAVGFILATVQLLLFVVYGFSVTSPKDPDNDAFSKSCV